MFPLPSVLGSQEGREVETSNRPEGLESDYRHPDVCHGNQIRVRPGDWAVSIDLSDAYFHIPINQKVPDILSQGNALAVQSSAVRSLHRPMDFYQGYGGGEEDGCGAGYYHAHVHR